MTRPFVGRLDVGRFDWERVIRGRLQPRYYAVALMLATFANRNGTNAHPGEMLMARALRVSTRTVRHALGQLDAHGWITRTHQGGKAGSRRGLADVYRLSLPAPVAAALGMWDDEWAQWMEFESDTAAREFYHDR
jgi:hypothetical protein